MTFTEAVSYIDSIPKFTSKNKPEHTVEMMNRLGRPERGKKIIHVAGTNGKGSVCAFLASMLTEGGKKTGLFTSPHLVKITERFQIDHELASEEEFLSAFEEVMKVVRSMEADGLPHPAYFELLYAVGMLIFKKREVEYIVLETGLGGLLDATNTIEHPILDVLTSISLDHTEYLGETVTEIAGQKAGILRENVPVVYDGNSREAAAVIEKRAGELHAKTICVTDEMFQILDRTDKNIDFMLNVGYYEHMRIEVPYPAPYQATNASIALTAMEVIDPKHEIPAEVRIAAIRETHWQGRMETILPGVIVDGAHNADGIRQFVKTLKGVAEGRRIVLLFSAVVEKDYDRMIQTICETGRVSEAVVTQIDGARVVPAEKLGGVFQKYTEVPVTVESKIEKAFQIALSKKQDGIVFCVGSLYLVGRLKELTESKEQKEENK